MLLEDAKLTKDKMRNLTPRRKVQIIQQKEVTEDEFEQASKIQEEVTELEQLLLERTDELNEKKGQIDSLEQHVRKLNKKIQLQEGELNQVNAILDTAGDKIEQYESLIQSLTEEVKQKQLTEQRITEQEVKAGLRTQLVDVSLSQASALNISNNSKISGLRS